MEGGGVGCDGGVHEEDRQKLNLLVLLKGQ